MANEREQKMTLIKELRPGMKNLQIIFIVLDIGKVACVFFASNFHSKSDPEKYQALLLAN